MLYFIKGINLFRLVFNIINLFNIRFKIVFINEFDIIIRNIFGYY